MRMLRTLPTSLARGQGLVDIEGIGITCERKIELVSPRLRDVSIVEESR